MNKWQIICPVAAMGLIALIAGFLATRNYNRQNRQAYLASASQVGRDLISSTNSDRLTSIGPALKSSLEKFLASPAKVHGVRWEVVDRDHPQTPGAVVRLVNDAGEWLYLTLQWEPKLRRFTPVGYNYPAPPPLPEPR